MAIFEKNDSPVKYLYYDYRNGHIAREKRGSSYSDGYRFEFYENGEWVCNDDMSINLSDAIQCYGGYSVFDYEDLTEEEAMRRIAEIDNQP